MINRERVLSAAISVFAEKGRYRAHMDDIARKGCMNKAMIYYFYYSKDELYFEVIKFIHEKINEALMPVAKKLSHGDESYTDGLNYFLSSYISFFNENPDYSRILIDALSNGYEEIFKTVKYINDTYKDNNITIFMKAFFEKGKAARIFRNIDTDLIIVSLFGVLFLNFLPVFTAERAGLKIENNSNPFREGKEKIIDVMLNGIIAGPIKNNKLSDTLI